MILQNISLSKEDFDRANWQEVIEQCEDKNYEVYSRKFLDKAKELEESEDKKTQEVYVLLGAITSLILHSESTDEPFAPLFIFQHSRSAIIDDFTDNQLGVLKALSKEILDAELKARVTDIIWIRQRDFQMAQVAVDSYIKSAQNLEDPSKWTYYFKRIERAANLAAFIGKQNHHFQDVISEIEATLGKYQGEDPLWLSAKLMELLLKYSVGDPQKYADIAEKAALQAESKDHWGRARNYWQIKANWHNREHNHNSESAKKSLIRMAENYVIESKTYVKSPNPSYQDACHYLEKAIETFRRIGGTQERVDQLHKTLLSYQKQAVKEINAVFSPEVNLNEVRQKSRDSVKDKTFYDAIFTLATLCRSPEVSQLREQVKESFQYRSLSLFTPKIIHNKAGKVIAHKPSLLFNDSDEQKKAIRAEMFTGGNLSQQLRAEGIIEPARYQINLEHNVRLDDWFPIVANNPFVPPNRELIFAEGLNSGLKGNFLQATHLLVFQLEESIRYLLSKQGIVTSSLDSNGIQNERDINTLLNSGEYSESIKTIFNEDILFDLQGLLVSRFGSNFRNRIAHALMDDSEFYSSQISYLWWLTLHLCCLPIIAQAQIDRDEN